MLQGLVLQIVSATKGSCHPLDKCMNNRLLVDRTPAGRLNDNTLLHLPVQLIEYRLAVNHSNHINIVVHISRVSVGFPSLVVDKGDLE